jgi:hypothetical protein
MEGPLDLSLEIVSSAPMAVIPGRLAVPRMQTFAQAWWQLLRCLLRAESGHSVARRARPDHQASTTVAGSLLRVVVVTVPVRARF